MSRKFNGTSQALSSAFDLSAFAQLSIAFWMWWDAYGTGNRFAYEYNLTGSVGYDSNNGGGFVHHPNGGTGFHTFGLGGSTTGGGWLDNFPAPSAAAWHHYVLTFNRATPVNQAYVDGVLQTLTTNSHAARTYGNFSNGTGNFMSRTHTTFFGAGRMAQVAVWGSILTARNALALSSGASPMRIGPVPQFYWPLLGNDSGEPDYGGLRKSATLTGTPTAAAHPPVQVRAF